MTIDSVTSLHPTHTKSAVADCRSPTHRRPLSPISKHHWDASNPPELDRIVRSLPVGTEAVKQNVWPRWQTRRWRFDARGSLKIATNRRWQLIVSGLFLEPESLSHWLPVQSRVEFEIACLARQSLTSTHRRQRHRGRRGHVPGNVWSAGDEVPYIPGKICQVSAVAC